MGDELMWLLSAIGLSVALLMALAAAVAFILYYRHKSKSMKHDVQADVANVTQATIPGGQYSATRSIRPTTTANGASDEYSRYTSWLKRELNIYCKLHERE